MKTTFQKRVRKVLTPFLLAVIVYQLHGVKRELSDVVSAVSHDISALKTGTAAGTESLAAELKKHIGDLTP